MIASSLNLNLDAPVLIGFGITGQAVAQALVTRSYKPVVIDDRPTDAARSVADQLSLELVEAPSAIELAEIVASASVLLPSPGIPDSHPCFKAAADHDVPTASEFDLAQMWDNRPLLTVTGTNGKTTVTLLVADALNKSGIPAVAVGNTDVPLVAAIDDPEIEVFVVEASSFRLGHSLRFAPAVSCWLNFAPDHLDAHASFEDYKSAKASIWNHRPDGSVAIANADDQVVAELAPQDSSLFSLTDQDALWHVDNGELVGPEGPFVKVAQLQRTQPHDLANALAAAAVAYAGGATMESIATVLQSFSGFRHRVEFVGTWNDVAWYNDSKATVPHATLSAVAGFDSVVLIAGGRNKGLDLSELGDAVPPVRAVVATGDAAEEITQAFSGRVPVESAETMAAAVETAAILSQRGDVVVLSPGCTSFDWYSSYKDRGDDFCDLVRKRYGA